MGFNIAPLSPMFSGAAAELPGLLYDQGQQRQDENLYLKLAQLAQMDRAQREEARIADARLKLQGTELDFHRNKWNADQGWEADRSAREWTRLTGSGQGRWLDLGDRWQLFDDAGNPLRDPVPKARLAPATGEGLATGGRRGGQGGPGQAAWDNYKRAMDVYENEKKLAGTDKDGNLSPGGNPRLNYFRDQAQGAYDQYQQASAEEQNTVFLPPPGSAVVPGVGRSRAISFNNPAAGLPQSLSLNGAASANFNPGVWTGQAAPMTNAPAATGKQYATEADAYAAAARGELRDGDVFTLNGRTARWRN